MSFCGRRQEDKEKRNRQDIEGQVTKNDGVDSGEKKTETKAYLIPLEHLIKKWDINPEGRFIRNWNVMFVVSCVIAVWVDPLFFYLPVINEEKKCLALNKTLRIIALSFRSMTDAIYVANMILQFLCPYIDENVRKLHGRSLLVKDAGSIAKRYLPYFVIDILAILPLPQVLVPIIFADMRGSKYLDKRKVWNAVVLFQYVPRVLRIYLSWTRLIITNRKLARIVWVKAVFNFFLYILASHVLGAFWYLFSIERETACWHIACQNQSGCSQISHDCDQNLGNYTFLNDYCPIQTQNTTLFDFGIFLEALQSGTVASTNVLKKIVYCFWWGLQNLSSLGQNLHTSTNFWENLFAVFISIFGLLLFLHFIGNVQTYIQLKTERSEDIIQRMRNKERDIDVWISSHKLSTEIKQEITYCIQLALENNKDVDPQNPLTHLQPELREKIKRHICLPLLKNVPMLKEKSEHELLLICEYLKLVHYDERSYIVRKGDPLDAMLFISKGSCWTSKNLDGGGRTKCIKEGDFYGKKLLDWGFNNSTLSDLPIYKKTVKAHTKVEAFVLPANGLTTAISRYTEAVSNARKVASAFRFKKRTLPVS